MYDVKQVDPTEWSSPPWAASLVEKPGVGTVLVGRGAVNQKGPEAAFLAALHAIRGAGRKLPVNLVLVAEGEEEIGSPHFPQIVRRPEVLAALRSSIGVFMPSAAQELDGQVIMTLGAKGVIEVELVSSGEHWGRGPQRDIHSSNKARVDSPAWHLVEALATLVSPDGNDPAIDGFATKARPLSPAEKAMIAEAANRLDEQVTKRQLGVDHWVHDVSWREALELLMSRPTVNIEGLVGGYTGTGGKTILPHRAVAKLDLRLVPDMTAAEALAALKAHLAKRGFEDIEVNMTGGYDPNSTAADAGLVRAQTAVYRRGGVDPVVLPRNAGSWPGYVFTGDPLHLPAGHFGLGHGSGAPLGIHHDARAHEVVAPDGDAVGRGLGRDRRCNHDLLRAQLLSRLPGREHSPRIRHLAVDDHRDPAGELLHGALRAVQDQVLAHAGARLVDGARQLVHQRAARLEVGVHLGWGRLGDGADRRQVGPQLDERRDEHVELGPHRFGGVGRDLDTLWRDAEQQAAEVAAAGELLAQQGAGGGARRVQAGGFRGGCLGHVYGKR